MVILLDSTELRVLMPHTLVFTGVFGWSGIPFPIKVSTAPPRYDDINSVFEF